MIINNEDDAAEIKTVTGWVSNNGRFFGNNERAARFDGCTHVKCACGEVIEKYYYRCAKCQDKSVQERFEKLEVVDWDFLTPIAIHDSDRYFFDEDDLYDYCADENIEPKDLRLVLCRPCSVRELIADEFLGDCLAEDADVPREIIEAADRFNEVVREYLKNNVLSWVPTNVAVRIVDATSSPAAP